MATNVPSANPPSAQALGMQMLNLATAHFMAHAIHVVAKLKIPDMLAGGPKSTADLAAEASLHEPSLYRLLRALTGIGIFTEEEGRQFRLSPLGGTLVSGAPGSIQAGAALFGDPIHWGAWQHLEHGVRTGKAGFELAFGRPLFDYLADHPDSADAFDQWMTSATRFIAPAIIARYDFSVFPLIVDVAGGQGALLAEILKANPSSKGILFDMPTVVEGVKGLQGAVEEDRYNAVGGSFFESVPADGDAYLLKFILHDWGDDDCVSILRVIRAAMKPSSKLLIFEMLVPDDNKPHASKFQDLSMMVLNTGGRERTLGEFRSMLDSAGFTLGNVIATQSPVSILECDLTPG